MVLTAKGDPPSDEHSTRRSRSSASAVDALGVAEPEITRQGDNVVVAAARREEPATGPGDRGPDRRAAVPAGAGSSAPAGYDVPAARPREQGRPRPRRRTDDDDHDHHDDRPRPRPPAARRRRRPSARPPPRPRPRRPHRRPPTTTAPADGVRPPTTTDDDDRAGERRTPTVGAPPRPSDDGDPAVVPAGSARSGFEGSSRQPAPGPSSTPRPAQWQVAVDIKGSETATAIDAVQRRAARGTARRARPSRLAIVLDGRVQSAPDHPGQNLGRRADDPDHRRLQRVRGQGPGPRAALRPLPVELEPQTVQTVSPTLGQDSLDAGLARRPRRPRARARSTCSSTTGPSAWS